MPKTASYDPERADIAERFGIEAETLYTCASVARKLTPTGAKPIAPSTVYRWAKSGRLRGNFAGRKLLIPGTSVVEFLAAGAASGKAEPPPIRSPASKSRGARRGHAETRRRRRGRETISRVNWGPAFAAGAPHDDADVTIAS